jgi:phage anti-repressor protein
MINQNAPAISQRVSDWARLEEITKELGEIIEREEKRHIMDQMFLGFEENLREAKELLLGIVDYDPTPQYSPHLQ